MKGPWLSRLWLLACTTLAGCSTSNGGSTQPSVAGAVDSGSPDEASGEAAGACDSVVEKAPVVVQQIVAMDAPAPRGGTVVDGTYFVTADTVYVGADGGGTGPTGTTVQYTNVVATGVYKQIGHISPGTDMAASGTYVTNGTGVVITQTCPAMQILPFVSYSVSGSEVTVYTSPGIVSTDNGGSVTGITALTYTKQ